MNSYQLITPAGAATIVIGLHNLAPRIARKIVPSETHYMDVPRVCHPEFTPGLNIPYQQEISRQTYKLLQMYHVSPEMDRMITPQNRHQFNDYREKLISEFVAERFKALVAKKKTEFYVPNLSLEESEKLSIKYLENFGSSASMLLIFKLSDYHKFVAMIDNEDTFQVVMDEYRLKGELVELNPNRWVLGRYGEDLTLMKEMAQNQRYIPNYYPGSRE